MKLLRVASRDTTLGVAQAHELMYALRSADALIVPELVAVAPDYQAQGKDPYLAALEQALAIGAADLCVHSLEDLPLSVNPDFPIVAVSKRRQARDALVRPAHLREPDLQKPVGVQGIRRWAQLSKMYPGWPLVAAEGDITLQLQRLDQGVYGALVLSEPDLLLLRQQERVYRVFAESKMITSCGQGIVAVQGRARDKVSFLAKYHDVDSWDMALAERSFSEVLGTGPTLPVAVRADIREGKVVVNGMLADQKGNQWEGALSGDREDAVNVGAALAARLRFDAMDPQQRKGLRNKPEAAL